MLKEGLLAEGGGPDNSGGMLNAINDDKSLAQSTSSMRKSRISNDTSIQGLPQFSQYDELFSDLTKRNFIDTDIDVVNVIITYDSKYAIAICADSDEHFELQGYSLKTLERVFTKNYNGEYVKMNVIEQNFVGDVFGVAYQDNGKFFVSFVNAQGEEIDNLHISEKLFLDDLSKPITGFWEPLVTCCFIQNDDVFISAYHREQKK
jgi:hypothetical protein